MLLSVTVVQIHNNSTENNTVLVDLSEVTESRIWPEKREEPHFAQ